MKKFFKATNIIDISLFVAMIVLLLLGRFTKVNIVPQTVTITHYSDTINEIKNDIVIIDYESHSDTFINDYGIHQLDHINKYMWNGGFTINTKSVYYRGKVYLFDSSYPDDYIYQQIRVMGIKRRYYLGSLAIFTYMLYIAVKNIIINSIKIFKNEKSKRKEDN